jgi:[methyl-Co(III) methanol-specific corrinoid protein]:coenzyme M methyltransferase
MGAAVNMGSDVNEPRISEYVIGSVDEWEKLKPIDLSSGRVETTLRAISLLKSYSEDVPVIGNITGPVSLASSLMEPVVFYKELRKKNESAHSFMRFVTEELIRFANAQVEAGADVIAISDPSGTGEILGSKFFEEFAVKYLNMLLDGIAERSPATIVHICGRMHKVYPQINMVRADALSFDSVVSLKEARENLKGRVLMGNVSTFTLEFGDEQQIEKLTRTCMRSGADIIAPACGLGMKSPLSNVKAILKAVRGDEANA